MTYSVQKTDEQWRAELDPEKYAVLRQAATERAWTGELLDEERAGLYTCAACNAELFQSGTKFDSHCGWPSFYESVRPEAVELIEDRSHGMVRTEVRCAACGSHLGHVFPDGFGTPTGDRYCMNSLALNFLPRVRGVTTPTPASGAAEASSAAPTGALGAVRARRSWSRVTGDAPTRAELETLVSAAGRVADHSSLRPWRLIELRGDDRERLGRAINKSLGEKGASSKPLRAPLLLAVVVSYRKSDKVPHWEQDAVASGVAHVLSLLLDEAGWGVIWRTGHYTRSTAVAKAHGLAKNEKLLGWLYVGGKPDATRLGPRKPVDASALITRMPAGTGKKHRRSGEAPDPTLL